MNRLMQQIEYVREELANRSLRSKRYGKVSGVVGTIVECTGLQASVGEMFCIHADGGRKVEAEVVGLRENRTQLMPYDRTEGMKTGCRVESLGQSLSVPAGEELLGRVVNENGVPVDRNEPLFCTGRQPVHTEPPAPLERERINEPLTTGVRAIDALNTIGAGQRVGLFAGSGVGKSVLMGMIARQSEADVNVIALIGERGREVQEFVEETLGEEGLRRSVVVAVTSDKAAMSRIKGAFTATAIAEYFRECGKNVLLMMDSVTRVAMAQREIGLASGEPPATKGYTPSVFAMLPKLLERPGRTGSGSITAIYTVLVDNDDMNEPVADAVRSILDGHIVLSRRLAHKNHFPAIDVLQSVSRVMPNIVSQQQRQTAMKARQILATYREAEELIQIGAYVKGSSPEIDEAIRKIGDLESFLIQDMDDAVLRQDIWQTLAGIVDRPGNDTARNKQDKL